MPNVAESQDKLAFFGVSKIEAQIYLALVNKPPMTIVELSKLLSIPRTSVYDHTQKLIEYGLIERIITYKSQQFRAYPLSILEGFIEKKKEDIKKLSESLEYLQQNIHSVYSATVPNTQVRYYYGAFGVRQMMTHALGADKEMIGYSQFGRADIVGDKFIAQWKQTMKEKNIIDRVITNNNPATIEYLMSREEKRTRSPFQITRIIDKKYLYISGDTTIYNNIFAVMYWKAGEIVGVEIENSELVKTQKSVFEILWKIAKPLAQTK